MKTPMATNESATEARRWLLVDAADKPLGRVCTEVARLLRGKHRPDFTPHVDQGDFVVVINAGQVALTGRKAEQKMHYRHSGYPGGLRAVSYGQLRERKPDYMIRRAVRGMLPRTVLGREALRRLKVYAGAEHPHEAQRPRRVEI